MKSKKIYPLRYRNARLGDAYKLLNVPRSPLTYRKEIIENNPFKHWIVRESYDTVYTYLEYLLNSTDRMTMGASIEARVPFKDNEFVDFVFSIPPNLRSRGRWLNKYLLKRAAERYMPYEQIYRPKTGFSIPVNSWIRRNEVFGKYISILDEERTLKRPYYNRKSILELLHNFRNKPDGYMYSFAGRVWNLLHIEMWTRMYIDDKRELVF